MFPSIFLGVEIQRLPTCSQPAMLIFYSWCGAMTLLLNITEVLKIWK